MMSKALVAYFSASGVTAKLAKNLADAIDSDLHEIKPAQPYTAADLDWTDKKSRSSVEMGDKSFRPEIANRVEQIERYDTIFVGFPIWWYVAPTIINTFLEQYDLSGKTIIPFCPHGGSGFSRTISTIAELQPGANVMEQGLSISRNSVTDAQSDVENWVAGLGF